jgi:hypothetical protein
VIFILIDSAADPNKNSQSWSWQRQLIGPVETLLSVRSNSRTARDDFELKQAKDVIGRDPVKFLYTTTESICPDQKTYSGYLRPDEGDPLSWHLNKVQACYAEKAWDARNVKESRKAVCTALGISEERCRKIDSARHEPVLSTQ